MVGIFQGGPGVGDAIMQAANVIIKNNQIAVQQQFQLEQMRAEVDQQNKVFALRQEEQASKDRALKLQEEQFLRTQEIDVLKNQKIQAEIDLTKAKTTQITSPTAEGNKIDATRVRVVDDARNRIRGLELNKINNDGQLGLPQFSGLEDFQKFRNSLSNRVSNADAAIIFQAGKPGAESNPAVQSYLKDLEMKEKLDALEQNHQFIKLMNSPVAPDQLAQEVSRASGSTLQEAQIRIQTEVPAKDVKTQEIETFSPLVAGEVLESADNFVKKGNNDPLVGVMIQSLPALSGSEFESQNVKMAQYLLDKYGEEKAKEIYQLYNQEIQRRRR